MATGSSHMIFNGTISINDMEVERRPYHKNCGCALHNLKDTCSSAGHQQRYIKFPKKMSWKECSMYATTLKLSSQPYILKS